MTHATDDIALAIAFYNGSAYFDAAIRSALAQSMPFKEIVVVNDGSRPEEQAYIEQAARQYGFQLITTRNGGQGNARNIGVNATRSAWICFLDQDDVLLPDHNRDLLQAARQLSPAQAGWVFANFMMADADATITSTQGFPHSDQPVPASLAEFLGRNVHMLPSAAMISRPAYVAIGGFDPQFRCYEDDDLFARLYMQGYETAYVSTPVYIWRRHGQQATRNIAVTHAEKFILKWREHPLPDGTSRRMTSGLLYRRLTYTLIYCLDHHRYQAMWPQLRGITWRHALRMLREGRLLNLKQLAAHLLSRPQRLYRLLLAGWLAGWLRPYHS